MCLYLAHTSADAAAAGNCTRYAARSTCGCERHTLAPARDTIAPSRFSPPRYNRASCSRPSLQHYLYKLSGGPIARQRARNAVVTPVAAGPFSLFRGSPMKRRHKSRGFFFFKSSASIEIRSATALSNSIDAIDNCNNLIIRHVFAFILAADTIYRLRAHRRYSAIRLISFTCSDSLCR